MSCVCGCFGVLLLCVVFVFVVCVLCACDLLIVENMANASVNAGVDRVCVRHLVGGCRGLPRLGEGRG